MTFVRRNTLGSQIQTRGLFGEYKSGRDLVMLAIAIGIEAYLAYFVWSTPRGQRVFGFYIVGVILLDFVVAFLHHAYACPRVLDVKVVVADVEAEQTVGRPDQAEAQRLREKYTRQLGTRKTIGIITAFILIAFALTKGAFMFELNASRFSPSTNAIFAAIFILTCIHLFFTGYAIRYLIACGYMGLWGFSRDLARYASGDEKIKGEVTVSEFRRKKLEASVFAKLSSLPVQVREHRIELIDGVPMLCAFGLLYNEDIEALMQKFEEQQTKSEIAVKALYLQAFEMGVAE